MVWVIAFGELFFGDLWCVVWGYGGMRTHFSLLNPGTKSFKDRISFCCLLVGAWQLVGVVASGFRIGWIGLAWPGSVRVRGGARCRVTGCRRLVMMLDHCGVVGTVVGRTAPEPPCCPNPDPALGHQGPGWRWWTHSPQPCHSTADADADMRADPTPGARWTMTRTRTDQS